MSSLLVTGSSASTTPTPRAKSGSGSTSVKPAPRGTKVTTVSAKGLKALALRNARSNSRGGHARSIKVITRLFKGTGVKNPAVAAGHHQVILAPPTQPQGTAGDAIPTLGRPPLAAAPLGVASNKLSPRDMKVLVISADGTETDLGAIKADLDEMGVPYTVLIATQTPLTSAMLWDGVSHGYYMGVILTTNSLTYNNAGTWQSAFTADEWNTLWNYESSFNVREVTSYTSAFGYPETLGLSVPVTTVDTTSTPLSITLTAAGKTAFPYLNPAINLPITNAWVYESTITDPANTVALATSSTGYPIITVHTDPASGRQNLAVTAANAYYLRHSQVLGYGIVNWVTNGLFLGKKRTSLLVQPDDLFIDDDQWNTTTHTDTTGTIYRNTSADWQALTNWQNGIKASSPLFSNFRIEFPFNAEGTTGIYRPDTLSSYVYTHTAGFGFVSHTYTHQNLDFANNVDATGGVTSAATIRNELTQNDTFANQRKLPNYFKDAMVQPDISGLLPTSSLAQTTAYNWGIRYWIDDTSQPGWNNPAPNVGFFAQFAPNLLIIPRHPTNIFYNVATQAQVVDEYNFYYAPGGKWAFWPAPRTYAQIIDSESDNVLAYMLQGDWDPIMFHSSNWRAYDGVHSVLGDLFTAVFAKYKALYNIPVQSPSMHALGLSVAQWMTYKNSGATAVLNPCSSIQVTSPKAATIPITGVTYGTGSEVYGGQTTSYVPVTANATVTVPLPTTGC
jgi:hypothetical protein